MSMEGRCSAVAVPGPRSFAVRGETTRNPVFSRSFSRKVAERLPALTGGSGVRRACSQMIGCMRSPAHSDSGVQPSSWLHEIPYSSGQRQRRWRKVGGMPNCWHPETPTLPPRPLVFVAEFAEFLLDDFAFVALNFNNAVFHRAAAAAFLF